MLIFLIAVFNDFLKILYLFSLIYINSSVIISEYYTYGGITGGRRGRGNKL